MSLEACIGAALAGNATIAATVGERIILGQMPTEFPLPAITFWCPTSTAYQVLQGPTDLRFATVRIHTWAEDYRTAADLLESVRQVVTGRVLEDEQIRTGTIVEDLGQMLEQTDPTHIHHGVLELRVPYRRKA